MLFRGSHGVGLPVGLRRVACWYAANALFCVSLKSAFVAFPDVLALTTLQLGLATLVGGVLALAGRLPAWKSTPAHVWRASIVPSAALFLGGTLATNCSLSFLAVGVTQLVKTSEPIFTCVLLFLLRGERPSPGVALSLGIIVLGLFISCAVRGSAFDARGIAAGLVANTCLQGRNILNKKMMGVRVVMAMEKHEGGAAAAAAAAPAGLDAMSILLLTSAAAFPMQLVVQTILTAIGAVESHLFPGILNLLLIESPRGWWARPLLEPPMFFCAYQMLSIDILSRVHPITHAVLNVCKRGVVTLIGVVMLQEYVSAQWILGLVITLIGILGFSVERLRDPQRRTRRTTERADADERVNCAGQGRVVLVLLVASLNLARATLVKEAPGAEEAESETRAASSRPVHHHHGPQHVARPNLRRVALHIDGQIRIDPDSRWSSHPGGFMDDIFGACEAGRAGGLHIYRWKQKDAFRAHDIHLLPEGNPGNLVWACAVVQLVDRARAEIIDVSRLNASSPSANPGADALLTGLGPILDSRPVAGITGSKMLGDLVRMIQVINATTVVAGIGTNQPFGHGPGTHDIRPGGSMLPIDKLPETKWFTSNVALPYRSFLGAVAKSSADAGIGVRGGHTYKMIHNGVGWLPVVETGCPSFMLNTRPDLGGRLQRRYARVERALTSKLRGGREGRVGAASARPTTVVFVMPNAHNTNPSKLLRLLLRVARTYFPDAGARFLLQSRSDAGPIYHFAQREGLSVSSSSFRLYWNLSLWAADYAAADLVISCRIHGSMLALATETPVYHISTDWRQREMQEEFQLPGTDIFDQSLANASALVHAVARAAGEFDAIRFDANRRVLAQRWKSLFGRAGIPLNPGVAALALEEKSPSMGA